jgi:hypothetical protein
MIDNEHTIQRNMIFDHKMVTNSANFTVNLIQEFNIFSKYIKWIWILFELSLKTLENI